MKKRIPYLLIFFVCLLMIITTIIVTTYLYFKQAYRGDYIAVNHEAIQNLQPGSLQDKIAHLFYTDDEIAKIQNNTPLQSSTTPSEDVGEDIEIHRLKGTTYQAVMMVVKNPEKLIVAVNPNLNSSASGPSLEEYIALHDGIAGINAGGFQDAGGKGNGGQAWGIVISGGQLVSGNLSDYTPVIGINNENKLVVGNMSAQQALDWGVRDAVTFGPIFIDQFQVVFTEGRHPGLNPRTVIGQREDGAFLLLVIDGRQPLSFGATYEDIIGIMQSFNAMTAANLDGGNSTVMVYDNETLNSTVSIYGARNLPTAFVVKK